MQNTFTTREIAILLDVPTWCIRRLFETRTVPDPRRFGGTRIISSVQIPAIIDALRGHGWLAESEVSRRG